MAYYQEIVVEYLRENRNIFVNTECCIQLNQGSNNDIGPHWYCDVVAVELGEDGKNAVYLCEVTYAKGLAALVKRLSEWNANWPGIKKSLVRDCRLSPEWPVTPWLFIPEAFMSQAEKKLDAIVPVPGESNHMPRPKVISLESIVPWRKTEKTNSNSVQESAV